VQRYLSEPLLIGGKKFDLRLYVLVTSYSPLTIYVYRSGFARFSHARFSMDTADLSDAMIHLTNVAVQKHNDHYDEKKGGKWDLRSLKLYLMMTEDPAKVHQLFAEMQDVILFSLLS
ncbi:Ttll1, partial [Symbiodinium sp. CCMP2456]